MAYRWNPDHSLAASSSHGRSKTAPCFIVRDHNEQALAFVYCEDEPGQRTTDKLLTRDEAGRIAANFAKLPELLGAGRKPDADDAWAARLSHCRAFNSRAYATFSNHRNRVGLAYRPSFGRPRVDERYTRAQPESAAPRSEPS
jgi:hypothetical protein